MILTLAGDQRNADDVLVDLSGQARELYAAHDPALLNIRSLLRKYFGPSRNHETPIVASADGGY